MGTILVLAEHLDGKLQNASLSVAGFGRAVSAITGDRVVGLVVGGDAGVASAFAPYVDAVVHVAGNATPLAEQWAPVIAVVAKELGATVVAAPATTTGKDVLPRTAARLDSDGVSAGFIADVIAVAAGGEGVIYSRPIWAGNLVEKQTSSADITCVTVRTTNFAAPAPGAASSVESKAPGTAASGAAEFLGFEQVKSDRPALTDASVVVSGGRGLKSAEAFGIIEELADTLGGAVGASRAAVDSGYAPNDWQVGQTGKIVAPKLYIAVAISGAIQHLAGMKGSKVIVAINKDPEAPIYQLADYGLVADAFKVVPELTAAIQAAR